MKKKSKATDCVHAGKFIDPITKGMVTPIYPSTSYDYINTEIQAYPRYFNTPNQKVVSEKLAILEHGETAMVLSSGMAAISTVLFALLRNGDHAIFQKDLYGGTYHAILVEMEKFGISYSFVDINNENSILEEFKSNTRLIYCETPSNPLMKLTDLKMVSAIAKDSNIASVVDNTFASPINQNPIDFGCDVVIHSGTKYLGGHSDICCGAIISSHELMKLFWGTAIHFGGSLNAETCSLLERSLKTLALRVEKQSQNALEISKYLEKNTLIKKVNYPGLPSHPQYDLAMNQMSGYGGMLSFELNANINEVDKFLENLKIFHTAMSLGGVDSIISTPAKTSHSKMTARQREEAGISDKLLRASIGIEDSRDLIEDIDQALSRIKVLV